MGPTCRRRTVGQTLLATGSPRPVGARHHTPKHPRSRTKETALNLTGLVAPTFFVVSAAPEVAATGDLSSAGTVDCADTFNGRSSALAAGGNSSWVVDINYPGDEASRAILEPGQGSVVILNRKGAEDRGFGNTVVWTSSNGREEIAISHLAQFGTVGPAAAGQSIGVIRNTGLSGDPHMHVSRNVDGAPARVLLSGRQLSPAVDRDDSVYGSCGTADSFAYVSAGGTSTRIADSSDDRPGKDFNSRGLDDLAVGVPGESNAAGMVQVFYSRGTAGFKNSVGVDDELLSQNVPKANQKSEAGDQSPSN